MNSHWQTDNYPLAEVERSSHTDRMNAEVAYLNGAWVPRDKLALPIDDLGFTLGTSVRFTASLFVNRNIWKGCDNRWRLSGLKPLG